MMETAAKTCPCCGAALPVDAVALTALRYLRLGFVQTTVLRALIDAYPKPVTSDTLFHAVYGGTGDEGPMNPRRAVREAVKELRKTMADYGWRVTTSRRGPVPGSWRIERLPIGAASIARPATPAAASLLEPAL